VLSPLILGIAVLNGLMTGAVYALVALGLTLIYGVLHIINFAHGALLSAALFAAFFAHQKLGLDPYAAALLLAPAFFAVGYALQRFIVGPAARGDERNMLLVTLGLAVLIENALLYAFHADTRAVDLSYSFKTLNLGFVFLAVPRLISFAAVFAVALALWAIMALTDTGKAIRAVAREKLGAELAGIDVAHVYAMTFGLGTACVAIAACLLVPTYLRRAAGDRRRVRAGRSRRHLRERPRTRRAPPPGAAKGKSGGGAWLSRSSRSNAYRAGSVACSRSMPHRCRRRLGASPR
jgi:branched-chain amino acid transport system permease protein